MNVPQNTLSRADALFQTGELHWLIDHEKLELAPLSPLAEACTEPARGNQRSLQERGLLGNEWKAARATLAQPLHLVRVLTAGVESTKMASFYANAPGELIGCWREADGWRISFPWTPDALAGVTEATVAGLLPIPPDPFAATLEPDGLMLLMAVVDAIREARLSAVLARQGRPPLLFAEADFERQLATGYAKDDASWSVTLLRLLSARQEQPDADALAAGLHELEAAQLLQRNGEPWEPSEILWRLAAYWTPPLPAVSHEAVTIDETGAMVNYRHGIVLRGEGPLWTIDYEGLVNGRPKVRLRSIAGADLCPWLTDLLEVPPLPTRSAAACSACGAALTTDDRFCPKCGTPRAEPTMNLCGNPACGQPMRPGAVFCHRCGWRSSPVPLSTPETVHATPALPGKIPSPAAPPPRQTSPPPATRPPVSAPVMNRLCSNPNCRKPVPPGKKFCTTCGTKVS